jgi:fucose 4-O-acetylase-like acetyltransferase
MNLRIATLRGLACLLLVLYHVAGTDASHGLRLTHGPVLWLNDALSAVRMPLFTFLSGLVYGLRPFAGHSGRFLSGKARRLLLPMLTVGTLFALVQALTPGASALLGPWYLIHLQPVAHFWFVESLFWVFLVVWALERAALLQHRIGFALLLGLACAVYLTTHAWPWLGLDGAIYLMPYFLLGLALVRFPLKDAMLHPGWRVLLAVVALGALSLTVHNSAALDRRSPQMLLAGALACAALLHSGLVLPWLAGIGRHSYAIYLFHVFFTASTRLLLVRLGIESLALQLLLGVTAGLLLPIALARLLERQPWTARWFLGMSGPRAPRSPASSWQRSSPPPLVAGS